MKGSYKFAIHMYYFSYYLIELYLWNISKFIRWTAVNANAALFLLDIQTVR